MIYIKEFPIFLYTNEYNDFSQIRIILAPLIADRTNRRREVGYYNRVIFFKLQFVQCYAYGVDTARSVVLNLA